MAWVPATHKATSSARMIGERIAILPRLANFALDCSLQAALGKYHNARAEQLPNHFEKVAA